MSTVIVLGGCGAVGSVVVKTLADQDLFSEIIIGNINENRAAALISTISPKIISFVHVNAENADSIHQAIQGCDLVVNCIGPFYKTVNTILRKVIELKINYVDVCDDVDVTLEILQMDGAAKKAGISALIGMGSSPGATNLLAKFAADHLLGKARPTRGRKTAAPSRCRRPFESGCL